MSTEKNYLCDVCKQEKKFAIAFFYPEGELVICTECLVYLAEPFLAFHSIFNKNTET